MSHLHQSVLKDDILSRTFQKTEQLLHSHELHCNQIRTHNRSSMPSGQTRSYRSAYFSGRMQDNGDVLCGSVRRWQCAQISGVPSRNLPLHISYFYGNNRFHTYLLHGHLHHRSADPSYAPELRLTQTVWTGPCPYRKGWSLPTSG